METKKETNYLIKYDNTDEDNKHKQNYFTAWRQFLFELEELGKDEMISKQINNLFKKYNIYFLELDIGFPSINIDSPKENK